MDVNARKTLANLVERLRIAREDRGIVKKVPYASVLERSEIGFDDLVEIYEKDEDARLAVDTLAYATVGLGYYTTSQIEEAKEIVDEFAEGVNLDVFLLETVREVIAYGNSFTELIEAEDLRNLKRLPISSRWDFDRTPEGRLNKIIQVKGGRSVEFLLEEIIHWQWNVVDSCAYGRGLLQTLAETQEYVLKFSDGSTKTKTLPSLWKIKCMMRDDLRKLLHHNVP